MSKSNADQETTAQFAEIWDRGGFMLAPTPAERLRLRALQKSSRATINIPADMGPFVKQPHGE